MASTLKRKEEATKAQKHQPGITQAKRPKLMNLVVDGTIDLKRYLPPNEATKAAIADRPKNNRERKAASLPYLHETNYASNHMLELRKFVGSHVEIRLGRDQLQHAAKNMKKRSIWGTHFYTADTDLFSALVHQGYLPARCTEATFLWPEAIRDIRALVKVHPSQEAYGGSLQNGVRSRAWASACYHCSYSIDRAWVVSQTDVEVELDGTPEGGRMEIAKPYFLLSQWDHRMSTRQITNASDRRRRNQSDVATIVYNLVNEPWLKYSSVCIADRGFAMHLYTAVRFQTEVLYVETDRQRFELYEVADRKAGVNGPCFRFSRCNKVLPQEMMVVQGTPLPAGLTTVLHDHIPWEGLQWGADSLEIVEDKTDGTQSRTVYLLQRIHWLKKTDCSKQPAAGDTMRGR